MERLTRPEVTGLLWLVARLWLGLEFLKAGWEKAFGAERALWVGDQSGAAVRGLLGFSLQIAPGGAMAQPDHPEVMGWYATLIRDVFLPHAVTMGLLMNLSYMLAGVSSLSPLMLLIEVPMVLTGTMAGYYGVDRYLQPYLREGVARLPRPHRMPARVAPTA
jgi:thiosulfate dehydrogenase [quinone] large subunit